MRVAVVDIGSNSTRLLIADIEGQRIKSELDRESTVTRLGAGVDADKRLNDVAMARTFKTLDDYKSRIDKSHADTALAILTSAVRDAENGRQFAEQVETRYDLKAHILSGDQEANLTFLGATSERDPDDTTASLVIDIGGGSTELVIGTGGEAGFHVSTQAGVVRQTERHLHSDPPLESELQDLTADVDGILAQAVPEELRTTVKRGIAVAGTATSLGAIAQELEAYDRDKVHGYELTRAEAQTILKDLAAIPLEERRKTKGLHPDRAPTIVAGIVILNEVLKLFELDRVEISEHDILRGAALGLIQT